MVTVLICPKHDETFSFRHADADADKNETRKQTALTTAYKTTRNKQLLDRKSMLPITQQMILFSFTMGVPCP